MSSSGPHRQGHQRNVEVSIDVFEAPTKCCNCEQDLTVSSRVVSEQRRKNFSQLPLESNPFSSEKDARSAGMGDALCTNCDREFVSLVRSYDTYLRQQGKKTTLSSSGQIHKKRRRGMASASFSPKLSWENGMIVNRRRRVSDSRFHEQRVHKRSIKGRDCVLCTPRTEVVVDDHQVLPTTLNFNDDNDDVTDQRVLQIEETEGEYRTANVLLKDNTGSEVPVIDSNPIVDHQAEGNPTVSAVATSRTLWYRVKTIQQRVSNMLLEGSLEGFLDEFCSHTSAKYLSRDHVMSVLNGDGEDKHLCVKHYTVFTNFFKQYQQLSCAICKKKDKPSMLDPT